MSILGGGFKNLFFKFTPTWGNGSSWLYNMFQMGWNHQLDFRSTWIFWNRIFANSMNFDLFSEHFLYKAEKMREIVGDCPLEADFWFEDYSLTDPPFLWSMLIYSNLQSSKAKHRLRSCEWAMRKVAWWQPVGILNAMGYEPSIFLGKDTGGEQDETWCKRVKPSFVWQRRKAAQCFIFCW